MSAYFDKGFVKFYKDLQKNNNKEWFHANKKTYEEKVKEPFLKLVQEVINEVNLRDPEVRIEAKEAVFRVNRDIRFAKDKSPYKLNVSAIVRPGGRKNKEYPGMYFELTADRVRIYGGVFMLNKEQLFNIRENISENLELFNSLVTTPALLDLCGEIRGDKNKRLDKRFVEVGEEQPLIYNKSFYYFTEFPASLITSKDLKKEIMNFYDISEPLMMFFREGF